MSSPVFTLRLLAANSALALIFKIISIPLGYITLVLIARLFGAEQMGTYAIASYLVAILSVVCRLGLDTGVLRFFAASQAEGGGRDLKQLFFRAAGLTLLFAGVAGLLLYEGGTWLANRFQAPNLPLMLCFVAPALPLSVLSALCGEGLRALGGVRWVVFAQDFLSPLFLLSLVVGMGYFGQGFMATPRGLGLVFLMGTLIPSIFLGVTLSSHMGDRQGACPGQSSFKDLLIYSWPLFLSSLLMLAFWSLDSLILGFFSSPEDVAYYESAAKSALIANLPLIAVNAAVPQLFAQLYQRGEIKRLEVVAQATSRWMYYLALPLCLLCLALAPEILNFFGPGFGKAQTALRVLALAQLVNASCGCVGLILAMTGHQKTLTVVLALAGVIGIPLMALAAALYGVTGIAVAKGLWLVGVSILMSLGVWRHLRIRAYARQVVQANLGGLLGISLFFLAKPFVGVLGGLAFFALGYAVLTMKNVRREIGELNHAAAWENSFEQRIP